jgi:hypothetical protein
MEGIKSTRYFSEVGPCHASLYACDLLPLADIPSALYPVSGEERRVLDVMFLANPAIGETTMVPTLAVRQAVLKQLP